MGFKESFGRIVDRLGADSPENDAARRAERIELLRARIRNYRNHPADRPLDQVSLNRAIAELAGLLGKPVEAMTQTDESSDNPENSAAA